jgi:hypothetical protein
MRWEHDAGVAVAGGAELQERQLKAVARAVLVAANA